MPSGMRIASIAFIAGMILVRTSFATIVPSPKSIPPTRKQLSAPSKGVPAMTPGERARLAEAMKRRWAEKGSKPMKPKHSHQPEVARAVPNR